MIPGVRLFSVIALASALAAPGARAQTLESVMSGAGIRSRQESDKLKRRHRVLESKGLETRWIYDWGGRLEEMETRVARGTRPLMLRDLMHPVRTRETFDPPGRLRKVVRWGPDRGRSNWVRVETETFEEGSRDSKFVIEIFELRGRAAYSSCVEHNFNPVPVALDDVSRITAHVLDPGTASADSIRVHVSGCESVGAKGEKAIRDGISQGVRCLLDPDLAGKSEHARARAQHLLGMMANPSQPFTIRCQTAKIYGQFEGYASTCPADGGSTDDSLAPFPGVTLSSPAIAAGGPKAKALAFHEMLHTLGFLHGTHPEVASTCEECCFGTDSNACALCGVADSPASNTAEYRAKLLTTLSSSSNSAWVNLGTLLGLTASAPGDIGPKLIETRAAILKYSCGGAATPSGCKDPNAAWAYAALGVTASQLRAQGRLPAASWSAADESRHAAFLATMSDPVDRAAAQIAGRATTGLALGESRAAAVTAAIRSARDAVCPATGGSDDRLEAVAQSLLDTMKFSDADRRPVAGLTVASLCRQ